MMKYMHVQKSLDEILHYMKFNINHEKEKNLYNNLGSHQLPISLYPFAIKA
jgi:hypothetical protein